MDQLSLSEIVSALRASSVFQNKCHIRPMMNAFDDICQTSGIRNGDDAAAIPDGDGYLLLAAEGIETSLVQKSPYLAGLSAVLANVNDIYAMGGRPIAVVDVIGTPDEESAKEICRGMRRNSARFGVPVVGGHSLRSHAASSVSMAILGRAKNLITSFDAKPNDRLVLVWNRKGKWLDLGFWNATLEENDADLIPNLEILPKVADLKLVTSGKDVSMAGISGTTIMLAESSGVGASIDLDHIEPPPGVDIVGWLTAFMSYGFLLAVQPSKIDSLVACFRERGVIATDIGAFHKNQQVVLKYRGEEAVLWDFNQQSFIGRGGE